MQGVIIYVALLAAFLVHPFPVFSQDQAETPTYKEGEFWQFRFGRAGEGGGGAAGYGATFTGGKLKLFQRKENQRVEIQDEAQQATLKRFFGFAQDERQLLQFPLSVGKKWQVSFQAPIEGRIVNIGGTASVVGVEQVTTPAGSFRAFKIERVDTGTVGRDEPRTFRWSYTYYYSPQTGGIVKYTSESSGGTRDVKMDMELLKFGPGK